MPDCIFFGLQKSVDLPDMIHSRDLLEQLQIIFVADQHYFGESIRFQIPQAGDLLTGTDTAPDDGFLLFGIVEKLPLYIVLFYRKSSVF